MVKDKASELLDRRLRDIRKELEVVNDSLDDLSKRKAALPRPADRGSKVIQTGARPPAAAPVVDSRPPAAGGVRRRDERLATYLASGSFDAGPPLRHERRIQRNRAILLATIALLVFVWVLYQFF